MLRTSSTNRRASLRPSVEVLEDRTVPAAVRIVQTGTLLTITGTRVRDRVQLLDNGLGTITVLCPPSQLARSFTGISQVIFNAQRGRDELRYDLVTTASFSPLTVRANLGQGNDRFDAFLNGGDLFFGANLTFDIAGQQGRDTLNVDAVTFDVDVFQGAEFNVLLDGGLPTDTDRDDLITFEYIGLLAGELNFIASGGNAADTIFGEIRTRPGSTGRIFAREFGEKGRDNLTLNIFVERQVSIGVPSLVFVDAVINGGPGLDTCQKTPNVTAISCELPQPRR